MWEAASHIVHVYFPENVWYPKPICFVIKICIIYFVIKILKYFGDQNFNLWSNTKCMGGLMICRWRIAYTGMDNWEYAAVHCSVLQCCAAWCSVLQCVAVCVWVRESRWIHRHGRLRAVSRIRMCHITYIFESCHMYDRATCHIYESVMSHIRTSHVA